MFNISFVSNPSCEMGLIVSGEVLFFLPFSTPLVTHRSQRQLKKLGRHNDCQFIA